MKLDYLSTDEDSEIRLSLAINKDAHAWIATMRADQHDAAIMRQILRTRRNNRQARAYAEKRDER